ncbi:hypothetical protein FB451DRAFT_1363111 [Mycena latifolia]|nr:hypothetical protein FB451DRAFT_1363111 [Mycena latifolia]
MFPKHLLTGVSAALLIGATSAFVGTAQDGFAGTTSCNCPSSVGTFTAAVPSALVESHVCCTDVIIITLSSGTLEVVFSGIYDAGAGTENIALSPSAFALYIEITTPREWTLLAKVPTISILNVLNG